MQKYLGSAGGTSSDLDIDKRGTVIQPPFIVNRNKMALLGHDAAQPEVDVCKRSEEQHPTRIYFSTLIIKDTNMITSDEDALN